MTEPADEPRLPATRVKNMSRDYLIEETRRQIKQIFAANMSVVLPSETFSVLELGALAEFNELFVGSSSVQILATYRVGISRMRSYYEQMNKNSDDPYLFSSFLMQNRYGEISIFLDALSRSCETSFGRDTFKIMDYDGIRGKNQTLVDTAVCLLLITYYPLDLDWKSTLLHKLRPASSYQL